MAIEDWCNWDVEEHDDGYGRPPSSFECPCKWCGEEIVMFPWWAKINRTETPSGWKPLNRDASNHFCEMRIKSQQRALVAQMPCLPEEEEPELDQPETVGPVVTKWVRRGHIMRFHPEEFFQERLIALKPGAELYDADAIPYYIDDGSGNPLREYYGRRAPEDFTVYTSDIDE